MPTKSGDQKLVQNYHKLIDLFSADTNYNPPSADQTRTALNAHYSADRTLSSVASRPTPV